MCERPAALRAQCALLVPCVPRRTVNLPTRQLDLHTFWSSLRLVLYDADPSAAEHLREHNRYMVCVHARHLRGEEAKAAERRLLSEMLAEADEDEDEDASAEQADAVRLRRPPPRAIVHGASWRRMFKCFM